MWMKKREIIVSLIKKGKGIEAKKLKKFRPVKYQKERDEARPNREKETLSKT